MQVVTARFGNIDFQPDAIIDFPQGIIGFPEARQFILLNQGNSQVIGWLQSIDKPELAFPVASAHSLPTAYPDVPLHTLAKSAGIEANDDQLAILSVVIALPAQPATVNLMAPIIIDTEARIGAQVCMTGSRFSAREMFVMRSELANPPQNAELST